jgi:alpha-glucuronidase
MQEQWETLRGKVDSQSFKAVKEKLGAQLGHAENWRDTCVRYFQSVNHKPLPVYLNPEPASDER